MSSRCVLLIFVVLFVILLTTQGWASVYSVYADKIHKCIHSLTRAVRFCRRNHKSLTIDSLIGLAILRDSLNSICASRQLPLTFTQDVCSLSKFMDASFGSISSHKSSHKLAFLFELNWFAYLYTGSTMYQFSNPRNLTMEAYVKCLVELSNSSIQSCTISSTCEDIFLRGTYTGSQLLKQAFYYLASCRSNKLSPSEMALASETLSSNLMMEFQVSYHKRYYSTQDRLHVLEQILYGGLGGYLQMAHPMMMDEIISWQDASGCFKVVKENEKLLPDSVHFELDVPLKGGCLLQLTSIAAAALTMHLYRFSTPKIFTPDFHSILKLETIFALNEKKYPDFIEPRLDSSRIIEAPYASVPDTVL